MFLLVRDEDVPTVVDAITKQATDDGLAPAEPTGDNPLAMLAAMAQPRAMVSAAGDSILVAGLASLDIAEPDEWASRLSGALETEVVAIDAADDGVRVWIYADGEEESALELPFSAGTFRSAELAELAADDDARRALAEGITAESPDELAQALVGCLAGGSPSDEAVTILFEDPLDEEIEPTFYVEALAGVTLRGGVGAPVTSAVDYAFAVSILGVESIEGVRFAISGSALDLLEIDAIDVSVRTRVVAERLPRALTPEKTSDGLAATVDDAYLERVQPGLEDIDMSDMFSTVQRLMSATEDQQRNTLLVGVSARGKKRGKGTLTLTVSSPAGELAPEQGDVAVDVVG